MESYFGYDRNGRITNLSYINWSIALKDYKLEYDDANNLARKNESEYNYDRLNQLVFAGLKGKFENSPHKENQLTFQELDDYDGQERLENEVEQLAVVELDYAAGSIGVD